MGRCIARPPANVMFRKSNDSASAKKQVVYALSSERWRGEENLMHKSLVLTPLTLPSPTGEELRCFVLNNCDFELKQPVWRKPGRIG